MKGNWGETGVKEGGELGIQFGVWVLSGLEKVWGNRCVCYWLWG